MQPSDPSLHDALQIVQTGSGAARVSLAVFRGDEFELIAFVGRSLLVAGAQMPCETSPLLATTRRGEVFIESDRVVLIGREAVLGRIEGGEFHRTGAVTLDLPPEAKIRGTKFIGQGLVSCTGDPCKKSTD